MFRVFQSEKIILYHITTTYLERRNRRCSAVRRLKKLDHGVSIFLHETTNRENKSFCHQFYMSNTCILILNISEPVTKNNNLFHLFHVITLQ